MFCLVFFCMRIRESPRKSQCLDIAPGFIVPPDNAGLARQGHPQIVLKPSVRQKAAKSCLWKILSKYDSISLGATKMVDG